MTAVIQRMKSSTSTQLETMPIVRVVDWDRIETQYRAGSMSTREIAGEHGISHTAINKKAKANDWARDLSAKVKALADAKVSSELVSSMVSSGTRITEKVTIEVESSKVANIRIGHRKTIARGHALCQALLQELEDQTFDAVILSQLGELMRNPDQTGMDRLNDIYRKVISTPGRIDSMKKLVETMKSVISMEREAYGINTVSDAQDNSNPMLVLLTEMKRSHLPIVYEVPRDDSL